MHILLTDVLVCPRCGPSFGLILLADRIEDRRVLEGRLGCTNCREQYAIVGGEADLRSEGAGSGGQETDRVRGSADAAAAAGAAGGASPNAVNGEDVIAQATRLAALLGVAQGPAYALLAGDAAQYAEEVAAQLGDVEVIAVMPGRSGSSDRAGTSHVVAAALPLAAGKMSGVALTGPSAAALLEAAARCVRPTGRLLVDPAPADGEERLRALGLRTLAREGTTLLAIRG